jgi:hypothetical protein
MATYGHHDHTLTNVRGEWSLVTMSWNLKRMLALEGA